MRNLLITSAILSLSLCAMCSYSLTLEASEPSRYLTEEVCEDPTGCPIVDGVCVTCKTRTLAFATPMVTKYKTAVRKWRGTKWSNLSHDEDGIEHDHSCEHCCFHKIENWN